uniref:Uncharacterized protein LOC105131208 isoform X2 n=1 Tax=Rhizophora mucronata TaxID=61149 RepID=A0A2P2JQ78_RHIMU
MPPTQNCAASHCTKRLCCWSIVILHFMPNWCFSEVTSWFHYFLERNGFHHFSYGSQWVLSSNLTDVWFPKTVHQGVMGFERTQHRVWSFLVGFDWYHSLYVIVLKHWDREDCCLLMNYT